jgi:hypothetical protein
LTRTEVLLTFRGTMSWRVRSEGSGRVVVTFSGRLDEVEGQRSADEFRAAMGDRTVDVVWDVRHMTGYDSGARRAWQGKLVPIRKQIRTITLVGGSAITRMGASAIALLIGTSCRFVETLDEVPV